MLSELLQPGVTDEDRLLLGIFLINLITATLGFSNDVEHELPLEGAQHSEEEVALRELVGELLLGGKVLAQHRVLHRILIETLD